MPMKVPNALELEIVTRVLTDVMTLRLYGNNKTPGNTDIAANYTEVAGGNYVNYPLVLASWEIIAGTPTIATYNNLIWIFNGALNAPNTIYGYFVTRNSDGKLMWAERFPAATVPFSPVNGSKIVVLPRFSAESLF